jgi:hypothetical protein
MADLDSVSKRQSSAQILLHWVHTPPFPTASITQAVRQHIAHMYSGILALAAAGGLRYTQLERYIRGVMRGVGQHW